MQRGRRWKRTSPLCSGWGRILIVWQCVYFCVFFVLHTSPRMWLAELEGLACLLLGGHIETKSTEHYVLAIPGGTHKTQNRLKCTYANASLGFIESLTQCGQAPSSEVRVEAWVEGPDPCHVGTISGRIALSPPGAILDFEYGRMLAILRSAQSMVTPLAGPDGAGLQTCHRLSQTTPLSRVMLIAVGYSCGRTHTLDRVLAVTRSSLTICVHLGNVTPVTITVETVRNRMSVTVQPEGDDASVHTDSIAWHPALRRFIKSNGTTWWETEGSTAVAATVDFVALRLCQLAELVVDAATSHTV